MSYRAEMGGLVADREEVDVLPLPPVVDSPAVVLLHLLLGAGRPVVLDAGAVREVEPEAAGLLEAVLRSAREAGVPVRVENAGAGVRRQLAGHPLLRWLDDDLPAWGDETLFVCPDRDALGFQPSLR